MNNRERAQALADFATDYCADCVGNQGTRCHNNANIIKCLRSNYIVSVYRGEVYTIRQDYPITDWRHYVFGSCSQPELRTREAVLKELRKLS